MVADSLIQLIKQVAWQAMGDLSMSAWGYVVSYNSGNNSVVVNLPSQQNAGTEGKGVNTPPLPLGGPWVGNGYGAVFAPVGGEQCQVTVMDRGNGQMVVTTMLYNDNTAPPPCAPGSAVLVPKPGGTVTVGALPSVDAMVRGTSYLTGEAALFNAMASDPLFLSLLPISAAALSAFASTELTLYSSASAKVGP